MYDLLTKFAPKKGVKSALKFVALVLAVALIAAAIATAYTDTKTPFEEQTLRAAVAAEAKEKGAKCSLPEEVIEREDIKLLSLCYNHGWEVYNMVKQYHWDLSSEEVSLRLALAVESQKEGTMCPVAEWVIAKESLDMLAICFSYGIKEYLAARDYPSLAVKLYGLYGQIPEFHQDVRKYWSDTLPTIEYFLEHDSWEFEARQTLGMWWERLRKGTTSKPTLTPELSGLMAIYEIKEQGHTFLAGFEIVDGVAKYRPLTRPALTTLHYLFGSASHLEKVLLHHQRPTLSELGWAALDLSIVAGTAGVAIKALQAGKVAGKAGKFAALAVASRGALKAMATIGKVTIKVAPLAVAYVAVTHPVLLGSAGAWVAQQAGISPYWGTFAAYAIGIFCTLIAVRMLIVVLSPAVGPVLFLYRRFRQA